MLFRSQRQFLFPSHDKKQWFELIPLLEEDINEGEFYKQQIWNNKFVASLKPYDALFIAHANIQGENRNCLWKDREPWPIVFPASDREYFNWLSFRRISGECVLSPNLLNSYGHGPRYMAFRSTVNLDPIRHYQRCE